MSESPTADARLPSEKDLRNLLRELNSRQGKISELQGEMGAKVQNAVDKKNVHKGALALSRRLMKMDGVKLGAFLAHFDHYREQLKIDDMVAEAMPGMEAEPEAQVSSRRKKTGKDAAGDQGEDDGEDSFSSVAAAGDRVIRDNVRRLSPAAS
jgi:hypothetical protein